MNAATATAAAVVRNRAYLAGGYVFFALGLVGIVLPVMPTTIFWIVAAALFARSSPRLHARILAWPVFGPAVADFLERGVIRPRGKILSLIGIGIGAVGLTLSPLTGIGLAIGLVVLAVAATYVVTRPSAAP